MTHGSQGAPADRPARVWPAAFAALWLAACALELAGRQVIRQSILQNLTGVPPPSALAIAGAAVAAGLAWAAWLWWHRRLAVPRGVALALGVSLVAGLAVQQQVGARLQSDGFFYFAFLRSIVNDRDVALANDYALIGVGRETLLAPTATGHAQTAWSVGPAIAWLPFYSIGAAGARYLAGQGVDVAIDGSSYPYRQAICIAGLCYGLLGFWFCFRLAARPFGDVVAALSTTALALGSFMTWYLVKEPTMSHATSMCAVAGFLYAWTATRGSLTARRWAALGLLGGFMLAVRWQNAIFLAFPAWDLGVSLASGRGARERRAAVRDGAVFGACALAAFAPQLAAWNAIYGSPIAVSPLSPQMHWTRPALVHVLWSARNGLFSSSPVTYVAAAGLAVAAVRRRGEGWLWLAVFCVAVYVNACVDDWWGGASYGARRFDGAVPLLVLGLGAAIEAFGEWFRRRPLVPVAALLALLVTWNVTAMASALAGRFGGSMPQSFEELGADQARTLHRWIGYPFSYPANLAYALWNGVAPWRYDAFAFPMLGDPSRPYGRVDVGTRDDVFLSDGWHAAESDPEGTTWRWSSAAGGLLVPLDHASPLVVQVRVRPFAYPGARPALAVRINGRPHGPFPLASDWQRVDFATEASAWRGGVNRVDLVWPAAAVPAAVGVGRDPRLLGGMVDYLRVQVPAAGAAP